MITNNDDESTLTVKQCRYTIPLGLCRGYSVVTHHPLGLYRGYSVVTRHPPGLYRGYSVVTRHPLGLYRGYSVVHVPFEVYFIIFYSFFI